MAEATVRIRPPLQLDPIWVAPRQGSDVPMLNSANGDSVTVASLMMEATKFRIAELHALLC